MNIRRKRKREDQELDEGKGIFDAIVGKGLKGQRADREE
jgi:hypothetical protein